MLFIIDGQIHVFVKQDTMGNTANTEEVMPKGTKYIKQMRNTLLLNCLGIEGLRNNNFVEEYYKI